MRLFLFILSLLGAMAAVAWALLAPAHLRAVDEHVLARHAADKPGLVESAEKALPEEIGTASLMQKAADSLDLPGAGRLASSIRSASNTGAAWRNPPFQSSGLQELLVPSDFPYVGETTLFDILRNRITREKFKNAIAAPPATEVLQTLSMTNTVLFAPAASAAGVPLEIAVVASALLVEEKALNSGVTEELMQWARTPAGTNGSPALEEFYLNIFVLAKRLTWAQLTEFAAVFQSSSSFDYLVRWLQENPRQLPILFTALHISGSGERVAHYLQTFPERGFDNIALALSKGPAALQHLLDLQQPVYSSGYRDALLQNGFIRGAFGPLLNLSVSYPAIAMVVKIVLLFVGGILLTIAWRLGSSPEPEGYVFFPQFSVVRQSIVALLMAMVIVVLGEPYLAYAETGAEPARPAFHFATVANAIIPTPQTPSSMINSSTIVALSVFFLLQTSLYIICLIKLAEIRRQPLSSNMKLKLLDNEENLFDSGLYAGLFGTALSLVLLTIGLIKPSLMAAYASTLFGILFVSLVKIVHVRPLKRRLIMDAQGEPQKAA